MNDLDILNQLLTGNHLSDSELERATKLLFLLNVSVKDRIKEYNTLSYTAKQLNKISGGFIKVKFVSENENTNFMDLTPLQFEKMKELLINLKAVVE